MAIQNLGSANIGATQAARLGRFKGEILAHAIPVEVLGITGSQKQIPKNQSDTVVFRRWLPYGAASTNQNTINRFFSDSAGTDRSAAMVTNHLATEGVTPTADTLAAQDITVTLKQYAVLYSVTDKVVD